MGVIAKGILKGSQGLFTPVSLGYPLSFLVKTLFSKKERKPKQFMHSTAVGGSVVGVVGLL